MDRRTVRFVWKRARFRCEYCQLPAAHHVGPFELEHILPRQHGGGDDLGNLALACYKCNHRKGPNVAGVDRTIEGVAIVPLFDPRNQSWREHFSIRRDVIVGRTPVGRVTVDILDMNEMTRVSFRRELRQYLASRR